MPIMLPMEPMLLNLQSRLNMYYIFFRVSEVIKSCFMKIVKTHKIEGIFLYENSKIQNPDFPIQNNIGFD